MSQGICRTGRVDFFLIHVSHLRFAGFCHGQLCRGSEGGSCRTSLDVCLGSI